VLPLVMLLALGPSPPPEPGGASLRWDAPPQCPDRAAVLAMIDATLGDVKREELHAVDVRGQLEPAEPEGFVLRLELDGGKGGARELRGSSCEELSEAAALLIAMAIDPRLLERQQQEATEVVPPVTPEAAQEAATEGTPEAVTERPAAPDRNEPSPDPVDEPTSPGDAASSRASPRAPLAPRERLRFLGRIDAGVGGGPLPGATGVLDLAVGLGGRGWRAELTAEYWTPRTRASASNPAIGVRAQLWALGVMGCGEPRFRSLSFPLCAGVLAGAIHARGMGDELVSRSVASRWVAVAVQPGLVWWVRPRLGLAVRGQGHVALARPELRSEPSGTAFVGAPVGGSLRAGLELRLP
jgi:hypothetical protein